MPIDSSIYNKGNITPFADQLATVQQRELENQLAMQRSQQLAQAQQLQADKFASGSNLPAAVQEYEYFKNLSKEEQGAYSGLRGRTNITDLGDRYVIVDRASGQQREIMKNSPEGMQITATQGGGVPVQQAPFNPSEFSDLTATPSMQPDPMVENIPPMQIGQPQIGGQKGLDPTQQPSNIEAQEAARLRGQGKISEREQAFTAARSSYSLAARNAGNVIQDSGRALEILDSAGSSAAGIGALLSIIPETDARALKGHIESVKSNIGIDKLLEIKATGAGLGQVPQSQLNMLASTLGNLDQAQTVGDLRDNLARTQAIYADVLKLSRQRAQDFGIDTSGTDFIENFKPRKVSFDEFGRSASSKYIKGKVYTSPTGKKATWNGEAFIPMGGQ